MPCSILEFNTKASHYYNIKALNIHQVYTYTYNIWKQKLYTSIHIFNQFKMHYCNTFEEYGRLRTYWKVLGGMFQWQWHYKWIIYACVALYMDHLQRSHRTLMTFKSQLYILIDISKYDHALCSFAILGANYPCISLCDDKSRANLSHTER